MSAPKLTPEQIINLQEIVAVEVEQYKSSKIDRFTNNTELAEQYKVSDLCIRYHLKKLIRKDDLSYRVNAIRSAGSLTREQQVDLQEIVAVEVEQHKSGKIDKFTNNTELAELYGVSKSCIDCNLRKLIPEDYLSYRIHSIIHPSFLIPKKQIDLQEIVAVEVEQHRRGEIARFTTNSELAEKFGLKYKTIWSYLKKLIPEEDLRYRKEKIYYSESERQKMSKAISKLSSEQQIDLQQIVAVEIEQHRKGLREEYTTSEALGEMFGVCGDTIAKYLKRLIPKEDLKDRGKRLRSEVLSRKIELEHELYGKAG